MKKVAITGSKGKTTVMYLIDWVLRKLDNNVLKASSTEGILYNDEFITEPTLENYLNIPSKYFPDYHLSEATQKTLDHKIYESEYIDIGVFTNIEENEHLERYTKFNEYLNAKKKISECSNVLIVNSDDKYWKDITEDFNGKVITVGKDGRWRYEILKQDTNGMDLSLIIDHMKFNFHTNISGKYNAQNIAMAAAILFELDISLGSIIKHIKSFNGVPGRFEVIDLKKGTAIIDYAHTPVSLNLVLKHIKDIYPDKKIVTVFGCGGNRTKTKRPLMGEIATKLSDYVYITKDNPRDENYQDIVNDIIRGVNINNDNYETIHDRTEAVNTAINLHDNNETIILIAGKGAEIRNIENDQSFNLTDKERIYLNKEQ